MDQITNTAVLIAILATCFFVLAISCRDISRLRLILIPSTLVFAIFGLISGSVLMIVASLLLFGINLFRYIEIQNISRRIRRTRHYGYQMEQLLPLMSAVSYKAGSILFKKGDKADSLFVLEDGLVEIVENGVQIRNGSMFGEFGLFTKDGVRTSTAICKVDCELRTMTAEDVDRLYFQQPEFALSLMKVMATRMAENIENLQSNMAQSD